MSDADEKPAFEIHAGLGGHVYKVYRSGRIEGFPPGMIIINRIPALVHQAFALGHAYGDAEKEAIS